MELASSRQRKLQLSVVDGVISALAGNQWCCGKSRVPGGPGKLIRSPPLSGRLLLPRQPSDRDAQQCTRRSQILVHFGALDTANPRDTSNSTSPPPTGFIANQILVDLVNINNSLVDSPLDERRRIPWLIKLLLDCKSVQSQFSQSLGVTSVAHIFLPFFSDTASY